MGLSSARVTAAPPVSSAGKKTRWLGGKFEMQIADGPADTRGSRRRDIQRNFHHRLRLLANHVARRRGFPNRFAILEWRVELETKLRAVFGRSTPRSV